MEVELTCPLGSKCEEIKDNKLYRCAWYTKMRGTDSQGNDHNSWKCSLAWMPILLTEVSGTNRGQTAAIESLRNETIRRQDVAIKTITEIDNARIVKLK